MNGRGGGVLQPKSAGWSLTAKAYNCLALDRGMPLAVGTDLQTGNFKSDGLGEFDLAYIKAEKAIAAQYDGHGDM